MNLGACDVQKVGDRCFSWFYNTSLFVIDLNINYILNFNHALIHFDRDFITSGMGNDKHRSERVRNVILGERSENRSLRSEGVVNMNEILRSLRLYPVNICILCDVELKKFFSLI